MSETTPTFSEPPHPVEPVAHLEVPLSIVIAEKGFPIERILELRPGVVLELPRRHDEALEVLVSGSRIGAGRAVDIGERLGFRFESIESSRGLDVETPSA